MSIDFHRSLPGGAVPAARMPVLADQVVATSQPLASQVGLHMLERGGTAADAAVAMAAALTVIEPTSNGIGGDAFCMVWDGTQIHGINASGRSPAALNIERLRDQGIPRTGWDAVTVPGCVSGWVSLWKQFGRLPFSTLLEPAIHLAEDGFPVAPQCAEAWRRAAQRYAPFSEWMRTFTMDGRTPEIGARWHLPDHAETLKDIAATEGDSFYTGDLAEKMVQAASRAGGALDLQDLAEHQAINVAPRGIEFGDVTLHELPPNGQGLAALVAAGVLNRLAPTQFDADDPVLLHLQMEAMKLGFADAADHVADHDHLTQDMDTLLSSSRLDALASQIKPDQAQSFFTEAPAWNSTVYLCCADANGLMVSFIQSNYEGFGSGIVIPETGIAMQNRGAGFINRPGHPNDLAGRKRPYHTIIPAMTTCDGQPHMAFGVMGGPMQPQGHLQVLSRVVASGWDPQAALDAPRWRLEGGLRVMVEPDFPTSTISTLRELGHDVTIAPHRDVSFGGGQAILRVQNTWCGASDGRRDGQAVGSMVMPSQ